MSNVARCAAQSNTGRHLAEFWMIEPEMAFADLEDNMDNAERFVKFAVGRALERCADVRRAAARRSNLPTAY